MSKGWLVFFAGFGTFVVAYLLCFGAYILATTLGYHDREGATGMAVAFMIGPLVALVCAVVAGLIVGLR